MFFHYLKNESPYFVVFNPKYKLSIFLKIRNERVHCSSQIVRILSNTQPAEQFISHSNFNAKNKALAKKEILNFLEFYFKIIVQFVLDSGYPDIKIEFNALRDTVALGRDGKNKKRLNAMIGVIIDAFYDPKEKALISLSGMPCKSISVEKRVHNTKFPVDLKTAIFSYFCKFIINLTV